MKTIASSVMSLALICGAAQAFGGDTAFAGNPQYNVKTVIDFKGTVEKVRVVPVGEAFAGVHLTIKVTKTGDIQEIFVAPVDFLKFMDVTFHAGMKDVSVTGSKVKFEGNDLVLAREVRIENVVLSLRDEQGFPNWLWLKQSGPTTGF